MAMPGFWYDAPTETRGIAARDRVPPSHGIMLAIAVLVFALFVFALFVAATLIVH
jgi:hypothetical protein